MIKGSIKLKCLETIDNIVTIHPRQYPELKKTSWLFKGPTNQISCFTNLDSILTFPIVVF